MLGWILKHQFYTIAEGVVVDDKVEAVKIDKFNIKS